MYHASPKVFHKRFTTWLVELFCFLNRKGGWDACIGKAAYIDHHYEQPCLDASNTMEGYPAFSRRSWSFEGLSTTIVHYNVPLDEQWTLEDAAAKRLEERRNGGESWKWPVGKRNEGFLFIREICQPSLPIRLTVTICVRSNRSVSLSLCLALIQLCLVAGVMVRLVIWARKYCHPEKNGMEASLGDRFSVIGIK